MAKKKFSSMRNLVFSLLIDAVGMLTYFVPGLGEVFDVIWAPISGILLWLIYKNTIASAVIVAEELIPFTDFIPTATIMWAYHKVNNT